MQNHLFLIKWSIACIVDCRASRCRAHATHIRFTIASQTKPNPKPPCLPPPITTSFSFDDDMKPECVLFLITVPHGYCNGQRLVIEFPSPDTRDEWHCWLQELVQTATNVEYRRTHPGIQAILRKYCREVYASSQLQVLHISSCHFLTFFSFLPL